MAKINPTGKIPKSPKLPVGRLALPALPTRNNAQNFNESEEPDGEINEQEMAAKVEQSKQQRRNQIKQEAGQAAKKAGKRAGAMAGTALGGPIGGLAGRFIGGLAGKRAGKKAGNKLADAVEKSGVDADDESAQAGALNLKKMAGLKNMGSGGGGGGLAGALAGEGKKQLKKKLIWYLLPWIPFVLFWTLIGLGIGLILFCFISVYNCTQKKGMIWTAWTTYNGGFTELLRESFSGTCLPDTTSKPPAATPAEPAAGGAQATGADKASDKNTD
jgi:hypothetical protein